MTAQDLFLWTDIDFTSRKDVEAAHEELFAPLQKGFSKGGARVRIQEGGASFTEAAAELEGFSRPLWGIVPYICGGGKFNFAETYRRGLVNGCNPHHQEYWGPIDSYNQILVDLAAIAFALCFTKQTFWDPLSAEDQEIIVRYLKQARVQEYPPNNWRFFKVLVDTALETVGHPVENDTTEAFLKDLESYYLGDGWYGDGEKDRIDYYNPFAMHYYSLIYVKLKSKTDPARCDRFIDRATQFAVQYLHWFSDDGASLPYGRSLVYRFASVGFWGIYASVLDPHKTPNIPWGVMKGIYLNNFKWWSQQPVLTMGSKSLSLGYSYPNNFMTERYNSPQSPYWATKAFSGLLMDESHPFWSSQLQPLSLKPQYLPVVGMHFSHQKANTIALINGPRNDQFQTEKYTKFAYSTRYGFGVVTNHRTFPMAHLDNMLGFSVDNSTFFVRESYQAYVSKDNTMVSKWSPYEGVEVTTWIIPRDGYHIRTHLITNNTENRFYSKEGGFAINMVRKNDIKRLTNTDKAEAVSEDDYSIIKDLNGNRTANVCQPEPNANILYPKTLLPELLGTVSPQSKTIYSCVVAAYPTGNESIDIESVVDGSVVDGSVVDGSVVDGSGDVGDWQRVPCNDY